MATVKSWGVEEVSAWLAAIGFEKLVDGFRDQEVDGHVLLQLTAEDLKDEFQLKLGDRKKLMERIENLKEKAVSDARTGEVGLMEQWTSEHPEETRRFEDRLTVTPRREDVDKFIIRKAVDEAKKGRPVRIVSNDNFRDYIGEVNDFQFSEDWVREHVPDSDDEI
eukprot:Skav231880  [mRNA]  locus=scaffold54:273612:276299:- [translate_table: standard]